MHTFHYVLYLYLMCNNDFLILDKRKVAKKRKMSKKTSEKVK